MSGSRTVGRVGMLPLLAMLAACAGSERPPVVEEYTGWWWTSRNATLSTISSDAAYRTAYILLGSGGERGDHSPDRQRHAGQFCPEPPPDVSQSVSAAVTAALTADAAAPAALLGPAGVAGTATAGLGVDYGEALATAVAPLIKRTQGLQFYRDQAFYTCVAYLNGVIGPEHYAANLGSSATLAAQVIMLEIVKGGTPSEASDFAKVEADLRQAVAALEPIRKILDELAPPRSPAQ